MVLIINNILRQVEFGFQTPQKIEISIFSEVFPSPQKDVYTWSQNVEISLSQILSKLWANGLFEQTSPWGRALNDLSDGRIENEINERLEV